MEAEEKNCRACAEKIPLQAKVCSHCGYRQGMWGYLAQCIRDFGIIATLISLMLLGLSIIQYNDSKQERISAKKALEIANNVKLENQRLFKEMTVVEQDIKKTSMDLKIITKYSLENSYILGSESFFALGGDTLARKRLERNMSNITQLIIKDTLGQKMFGDTLQGLFPGRKGK